MKRIKPADNEIYHIFNRGVDKRDVFIDEKDYFRFIHDLWEFNDWAPAPNIFYRQRALDSYEVAPHKDFDGLKEEKKGMLVDILAYSLMPNHFHLMVRQLIENGVTDFMRKIGTGYTGFFNKKYQRHGYLFQGVYKITHLKNHSHFLFLPYYIHLNPLDLKFTGWQERKIKNLNEAIKFLNTYRWSSHLDYTGQKNFPSVIKKNFLLKIFGGEIGYKKDFEKWLKDLDMEKIKELDLE